MDIEKIRVRIMSEAYDLADRGDFEGYNAVKVMCGDVLESIAAVVAAEREACARLCDQMFHDWCNQEFEDEDEAYRNKPDAEDCKKAIRERS
jgi:hypothetical protein